MPGVPQVAVFDTGFHQTMPDYAYMYALPYEYYEKYGIAATVFTVPLIGMSANVPSAMLGKCPSELKIVTCHSGTAPPLRLLTAENVWTPQWV